MLRISPGLRTDMQPELDGLNAELGLHLWSQLEPSPGHYVGVYAVYHGQVSVVRDAIFGEVFHEVRRSEFLEDLF